MSVSAQFNAFVLDLLGDMRTGTARRTFGGAGYYADGLFFAIADEDILYFRVDDNSRSYFEAEGMEPFAAGSWHKIDELLHASRAAVRRHGGAHGVADACA